MEKLFTLIKKVGIEKADLDQFVKQVQCNARNVIQYIEPKVESSLEIIRRESNIMFEEVMKDLKPLDEVAEDNKKFKPINDVCFQDFLEFHGVWDRYKLISGLYKQQQVHEFIGNTTAQNWLLPCFFPTTEEELWENLHYQWKECYWYAADKNIKVIFNREENESPEYFIKDEEEKPSIEFISLRGFITKQVEKFTWEDFLKIISIEDMNFHSYKDWIANSTVWMDSKYGYNFWKNLDDQWQDLVQQAEEANIKILWDQPEGDILSEPEVVLNFKIFLEENGINVSEFKQWTINDIGNLNTLKLSAPGDWINDAFDWSLTTGNFQFWEKLDTKWKEEVERAKKLNRKIVFNLKEEKLNFKKFLKRNNILQTFKQELVKRNYCNLYELKRYSAKDWIDEAFDWSDAKDEFEIWDNLHDQWQIALKEANDKNIKVVFGFKV